LVGHLVRLGARDDIADEEIPKFLERFANEFPPIQEHLRRITNDDPEVLAVRKQAAALLDAGNLDSAKARLAQCKSGAGAALGTLGESDIPPERLAAKLVEIAESFKALRETASARPGDSPRIVSLRAEAQKAIEAGELAKASELLTDVVAEQTRSLDRLAVNAD
jgi:hypothetical protein